MKTQNDNVDMKKRLTNKKEKLKEQIKNEKQKIEATYVANPDRADLASDYTYRGRRNSLMERLEDQLDQVNQALQRIENGSYGLCTNCGKAILSDRLEVLPYAALCIECQRQQVPA
jgi:RNA polymerase-binding protein DksA